MEAHNDFVDVGVVLLVATHGTLCEREAHSNIERVNARDNRCNRHQPTLVGLQFIIHPRIHISTPLSDESYRTYRAAIT